MGENFFGARRRALLTLLGGGGRRRRRRDAAGTGAGIERGRGRERVWGERSVGGRGLLHSHLGEEIVEKMKRRRRDR